MKRTVLRSLSIGALSSLILVGVSACNNKADTPTSVIYTCEQYTVYTDSVTQGSYTARANSPYEIESDYVSSTDTSLTPGGWKIELPDSRFPQFSSDHKLVDALYNMAIAEIASDIRPDGLYKVSDRYEGVWTRDLSYSIILSLAYLDPDRAMRSLRYKVRKDRIMQDTGIGGSWPISSDRIVWAIAAYEVYKVTGNRQWLKEIYRVIKTSLDEDMPIIWNSHFKLMHGEQSYLNRREQAYPDWMQSTDIFATMCLGTNALYAHTFGIMGEIADSLGLDSSRYKAMSKDIATSLNNNLWIPTLGYYSEYLYGGIYPLQSQATDNLGQSLAIIFGIANDEMARSIISKTPVTQFGTTSVYPPIDSIGPYHANAIWPFVQSFWNIAAAKVGNMEALTFGLGALYRSAAMFGSYKELYTSSTGDYSGYTGNSDQQLLSCAGGAAMVMRVYAGMSFTPDGIRFKPVIPPMLTGEKTISDFHYRNSDLTIRIIGTGNIISKFIVDGNETLHHIFPANNEGAHTIEIVMADNTLPTYGVNVVVQQIMPTKPNVSWSNRRFATIKNFDSEVAYNVYINGIRHEQIKIGEYELCDTTGYTVTAITTTDCSSAEGYTMRPREYIPAESLTIIEAESLTKGGTKLIKEKKTAKRFVEMNKFRNTRLRFAFDAPASGEYLITVYYSNGNGPVNTDNHCAIRTLTVNGSTAGTFIMPRRGTASWTHTGRSNMLRVNMSKGINHLSIDYHIPAIVNMDGVNNNILIDYIRIIKK